MKEYLCDEEERKGKTVREEKTLEKRKPAGGKMVTKKARGKPARGGIERDRERHKGRTSNREGRDDSEKLKRNK